VTRVRAERTLRAATVGVTAAVALTLLAACGSTSTPSGDGSSSTSGTATASGGPTGRLTVFAAASLQESFTTIADRFEKADPGVSVTLNFGASSALANGITQGQPADVFASASRSTMDGVVAARAATGSTPFASNVMEIAVPRADPGQVSALADLARPGVKVAVCQAQVPCGTAAAKVFDNAGITVQPVSEEADVKAVLTKVRLGEVDAGVVYVTDVRAAGDEVTGVPIPADVNASTTYPIATLTGSRNPAAARAFVDYVLSPAGREVLVAAGFAAP
jgi:molybdate transport system substrate-binding protein